MLWKSPHPDLIIAEDVTTWQWAFEGPEFSARVSRNDLGSYNNAVTNERLDFAEVKELATYLSTAVVRRYGLKPDDTVSLFSTNTIWYPVAMWAAVRVGARINGASPDYKVAEISHALKTAGTKFMFTLPSSIDVAIAAADAVGLPREHVFLLEGVKSGFLSLRDLVAIGRQYPAVSAWRLPAGKSNKEVCGYLNFSSGTTGLPKAVMLSHHNIIAQCHQLQQLQLVTPGQRYRVLAVGPLYHITGMIRICHYPVLMNGDGIMLPAFSMEAMLKAIVRYDIEELILVPPILIRLTRDSIVDKYMPDLQRIVKRWSSGSAPVAPEVVEQMRQKFPNTGFRQGYGATESTACISCHPPSHYDYKYASAVGLLCANTVAKVIDIDNPARELGPNETGEICAKGPQIAMGYLGNASATAESFRDGFLHTGDVGHIDEEGLIYIEDRIKEMIKVKGLQVAPAELEDTLLGHDEVEDCAVLGIPDAYAGERPKAYVVLRKSTQPTLEIGRQLLRSVNIKMVRYKSIVEIEFIDVIPKSATGKLLRRVLKSQDREAGRTRGVSVRDVAERARL